MTMKWLLSLTLFSLIGLILFVWKLFSGMEFGLGNSDYVKPVDGQVVNLECLYRVEITGHVLDFMVTHPENEVQNFLATFRTPVEERNAIAHRIAENPEELYSITSKVGGMNQEQKKAVVSEYFTNYSELREMCG